MIEFSQVLDLMKVEPGHGLVQCLLLLMIWFSARGIKKEIVSLKDSLRNIKDETEDKITDHEKRIRLIENKQIG
jgi:hypothetical protein